MVDGSGRSHEAGESFSGKEVVLVSSGMDMVASPTRSFIVGVKASLILRKTQLHGLLVPFY